MSYARSENLFYAYSKKYFITNHLKDTGIGKKIGSDDFLEFLYLTETYSSL